MQDPRQREKKIIIDDLASYEQEIGVSRPRRKRGRLSDFLKNVFVGLLLVGIVVGSFWVSFLIGKRVLVPVKTLSTRELEPIEEDVNVEVPTSVVVIPVTEEVEEVVEIPSKIVEPEPEMPETLKYYKVQAGPFASREQATLFKDKLDSSGFPSFLKKVGDRYRVQIGAFRTKGRANTLLSQVKAKGFDADIIYE